jgi:hypothetical protein
MHLGPMANESLAGIASNPLRVGEQFLNASDALFVVRRYCEAVLGKQIEGLPTAPPEHMFQAIAF